MFVLLTKSKLADLASVDFVAGDGISRVEVAYFLLFPGKVPDLYIVDAHRC